MTPDQRKVAEATLAAYGATLDDEGFIVRNGSRLSVRVAVERKRLCFVGANGQALATGAINAAFVRQFGRRHAPRKRRFRAELRKVNARRVVLG